MTELPRNEPVYGPAEPGSGLAITAFVFSLLSLICLGPLAAIPGLVIGIIAITRASATPPTAGGKGFAIAAVAISGAGLLLSLLTIPLLIGILLPALGQARQSAQRLQDSADLRMMAEELTVYAIEQDDQYPETADGWQELLISRGMVTADMFTSARTDGIGADYFFVPGATVDFDSTGVLVYQDPAIDPDATLIGFRDAHIENIPQAEALRILAGLTLPDGTPYVPHLLEPSGVGP